MALVGFFIQYINIYINIDVYIYINTFTVLGKSYWSYMEQIWAINEIPAAHPKRLSVSLLELLHDHKVFIGCSGLHSRRYKHSRDDLRCQAPKNGQDTYVAKII